MTRYHYCYKIINLTTLKEYIGIHSTDDLDDGYMGSSKPLNDDMEKYGPDNFKRIIIGFADSRADIFKYEGDLVDQIYIDRPDTYNIAGGGYNYGLRSTNYDKVDIKITPLIRTCKYCDKVLTKENRPYHGDKCVWKRK